MARYVVSLWTAANRECAVTRQISRADDSRAILYAESWLHKSCISTRILWISYDRWTVQEVIDGDERRHVRDGVLVWNPAYKAGFKVSKKVRAKATPGPFDGNGYIYPTTGSRRKAVSPLRARMNELIANALEGRKTDGTVSRMGRNPNNQE